MSKNKKDIKNSENIHIVSLSDYTTPKVVETRGSDWVGYGEDNDYFDYLISLSNSSPTNSSIINGMVDIIYGGGLDAKNKNRKPDEYAQFLSIFKREDVYRTLADLKLMGNACMQVVYSKDKTKITAVKHFPVETLRATKADENGVVKGYAYSNDWANLKPREELDIIPAFGYGGAKDAVEILYIKPYRSGFFYYSPVDYQGSLPYCEMEGEISNFHINNIKNGFSPSYLINFNNGVPDERTQKTIERQVINKYSGSSNAGTAIIAFNDDKEQAATIDAVQLSDADKQYQFISDESMRKIMLGHRVTSPMLLGIKDNSGLGNNADEIKTAFKLFEATVINPFRIIYLSAVEQVLSHNDISLDVYFKSLNPFKEEDNNSVERSQLSSDVTDIGDEDLNQAGNWLIEKGEELDDEWEEVDSQEVSADTDTEELNNILEDLEVNLNKDGFWKKLSRAVGSAPSKTSEQDTSLFKVRYRYAKPKTSDNSREFCKKMVSAGKVYRKEDIEAASDQSVNAGFGKGGADNYSIWLHKGGARCHHFWERVVYLRRNNKKITANEAKKLINKEAPSKRKDAKWEENDKRVATRPVDMPNEGFVKKQ